MLNSEFDTDECALFKHIMEWHALDFCADSFNDFFAMSCRYDLFGDDGPTRILNFGSASAQGIQMTSKPIRGDACAGMQLGAPLNRASARLGKLVCKHGMAFPKL